MPTMSKRLQVLLDEARYTRLEQQAARRGTSIATLVREAIDAAFPVDGPDRTEAARRVLDAAPIEVSDWSLMKAELDQMYDPATR